MILSFHPCFEADVNRICAGRGPHEGDVAAMQAAAAVILPQGCRQDLWQAAVRSCPHVFPDYHARFQYGGKTGQIRLFRRMGAEHPPTAIYRSIRSLTGDAPAQCPQAPFEYPFVFKFDWGGEGETVYLIRSQTDFARMLDRAAKFEKSGQNGFLLQRFIPCQHRALRVVVIGRRLHSYWRIDDPVGGASIVNLARGASIEVDMAPDEQARGRQAARIFCRRTGINLAGFDFLFNGPAASSRPAFLEINYFFGRRGLGGSERFYQLLTDEIHHWLKERGIAGRHGQGPPQALQ